MGDTVFTWEVTNYDEEKEDASTARETITSLQRHIKEVSGANHVMDQKMFPHNMSAIEYQEFVLFGKDAFLVPAPSSTSRYTVAQYNLLRLIIPSSGMGSVLEQIFAASAATLPADDVTLYPSFVKNVLLKNLTTQSTQLAVDWTKRKDQASLGEPQVALGLMLLCQQPPSVEFVRDLLASWGIVQDKKGDLQFRGHTSDERQVTSCRVWKTLVGLDTFYSQLLTLLCLLAITKRIYLEDLNVGLRDIAQYLNRLVTFLSDKSQGPLLNVQRMESDWKFSITQLIIVLTQISKVSTLALTL